VGQLRCRASRRTCVDVATESRWWRGAAAYVRRRRRCVCGGSGLVADGCGVDECDVGGASTVADVSVGECDDVSVFRTIKCRQRRLDRVLTAPSGLHSVLANGDLAGTSPSPRDGLSSMSHALV
jgi:hypothetical protein